MPGVAGPWAPGRARLPDLRGCQRGLAGDRPAGAGPPACERPHPRSWCGRLVQGGGQPWRHSQATFLNSSVIDRAPALWPGL